MNPQQAPIPPVHASVLGYVRTMEFSSGESSSAAAAELIYVATLGGPFLLYPWSAMARREDIGKVAPLTYATPPITIAYQCVLSGAPPSPVALLGVACMLSGIYVARRRARPAGPSVQPVGSPSLGAETPRRL